MNCQICNHKLIEPYGKSNDVCVIFDEFTLETYNGERVSDQFGFTLLRNELGKLGLDLYQMRTTCMWLHPPTKKNFEDAQWNFQQAMLEAMGKRFVLLLGSGATKFFLNHTATAISGLPLHSDLLGAEYVMGTLNPNACNSGLNGEAILGISKFAKLIKEKK